MATRSYLSLIERAKVLGYKITLLYIWLDSPETAKKRVAIRVMKGGHNIPDDVIERRYYRGIYNLINLFISAVNTWMIVNSTNVTIESIAEGTQKEENVITNDYIWNIILTQGKKYEN